MKTHVSIAAVVLVLGGMLSRPCAAEPRVRIFDLETLLRPIQDHPGPEVPTNLSRFEQSAALDASRTSRLGADRIVDMILEWIDSETWDGEENRCTFQAGRLVVSNAPDVLDRVEAFLGALRSRRFRMVTVEALVVSIDRTRLAALTEGGALMKPGAFESLREGGGGAPATRLKRLRLTAFDRQRTHVMDTLDTRYVQDIDVEVASDSMQGDPILGVLKEGACLDVRPVLDLEGEAAKLHVRFWMTERIGPMEVFETKAAGLGAIQMPRLRTRSARCSVLVPLGRAVVLSSSVVGGFDGRGKEGSNGPEKVTAVLLRADAARAGSDREALGKERALYGAGCLLSRPPDFEATPPGGLETTIDGGMPVPAGGRWVDEDEPRSLAVEDLHSLIIETFDPDAWGSGNRILTAEDAYLLVKTSPDVQKRIRTWLQEMESAISRQVSVEAHFLAVDREGGGGSAPGAGTTVLSPEAVKEILAEARQGERLRCVASARVTGFSGQRVCVTDQRSVPYVKDYDVEVAQGASMADPIMGAFRDGLSLTVRPTFCEDSKTVLLEVVPALAWTAGEAIVALVSGTEKVGRIQVPSLEKQALQASVRVVDGGGIWLGLSTRTLRGEQRGADVAVLLTAKGEPKIR